MRIAPLFLLAFAGVALLAACKSGGGATPGPQEESPTPAFEDVCLPNPDPATADVAEVDSPSPGDALTSPVSVTGRIVAFEAQFNITIFDAAGDPIADVPARSQEGQVLSPFSAEVPFSVTEETNACIWVYDISEADGITPLNVVQVPVTLLPGGEPEVCQPNPDPGTPEFVVVDQPSSGDEVTSPVTISGRIVANEATFNVTIYDSAGDPLVDVTDMNEQTDVGQLAPFSLDVEFDVGEPTPACIWVYDASERDGSPTHVQQIPVTLSP